MKAHHGVVHRRAIIEESRGFKLAWGKRVAADFVGLLPDAQMLTIECKSVEGQSLSLASIQPQQRTHLSDVAAAGGVALLVLEFRDEGAATRAARQYLIP
jgi:penicillin-binding protein-related factor A (putative recombinase)